MKFEWNEDKNKINLIKHGIDFHYAISIFLDKDRIEWEDIRKDYGENRYITIGNVEKNLLTVVYTLRHDRYRLISARGARKDERETYYSYIETNEQTAAR